MNKLILCISSLLLLTACSVVSKHETVPQNLADHALPLGMSDLRYWGDSGQLTMTEQFVKEILEQQDRSGHLYDEQGELQESNYLVLSGGGENGAFGAGILKAWSDHGTRPQFNVVSGVSTGALIAVFAYLGPEYDQAMTDFYTTTQTSDIYSEKSIFTRYTGISIFDTAPFEKMVRSTINEALVDKVAQQSKEGKVLLVGTTHLDSQRLSIWNMGKIAEINSPESLRLFQDIILASTALPGAFPAIQIDVLVGDHKYQELHVDGGATRQAFLFPDGLKFSGNNSELFLRERNLYVIRNGEFYPRWQGSELSLPYITSRSLSTLIKYQSRGDIMRIYEQSQQINMQFKLAYMNSDFNLRSDGGDPFNSVYMKALYDVGYERFRQGELWEPKPPQFNAKEYVFE